MQLPKKMQQDEAEGIQQSLYPAADETFGKLHQKSLCLIFIPLDVNLAGIF